MAPLIRVAELSFAYPDGTPALERVSFDIGEGESVALVGANGAGKSTLLMHLNGVLSPASGTVRIGEELVSSAALPEVRKLVGMVFQDPDDQLFMPSVYEDVAFGPANLGLSRDDIDARVAAALECVGALALRDRPPYRLSFGEKRAVAIATVLSMRPRILVMDEPTSNLDPRARRRLIELLATLGQTQILATHDLDMAVDACGRTIVLDHGSIAADGPTLEIFRDEALLERCQLELPLGMRGCPKCGRAPSATPRP